MAGTSPAMTNIECQEWAFAQASAASSRSLPQNSSSPMVKDGAPNRPRDAASSVCRRSASLFSGVFAAATPHAHRRRAHRVLREASRHR